MRLCLSIVLACLSFAASADRLIFSPSGRKLEFNTGRAEFMWEASTQRNARTFMGVGLTRLIEVDLTSDTLTPRGTLISLDASYTFADPVVNFVPGLMVGLVDALNRTEDGRRFYVATSYDIGLSGLYNGGTPMQLTVGAMSGGINGPFVGVTVPFSGSFIGIAEHDSRKITAGFEFRPTSDTSLRWLFSEGRVLWSAGFSVRY